MADTLDLSFDIHDAITQEYIATLDFDSWAFNDPVGGAGSFSGEIPVRADQQEYVRAATVPWSRALYVKYQGAYLWGGPIISRPWKRSTGTLVVNAEQWEGWLYRRFLQKKFVRLNKDQFSTVRTLVSMAIADNGCPRITIPISPASIVRDLTVDPWTSYGEAIDNLAARDPGFEWSILVRSSSSTGNPELYLALWSPERRSAGDPEILLESVLSDHETSYSNAELEDWPEDSSGVATRVWATGEGSPPDQISSNDEDPQLEDGTVLLTETVTNWSGVTKRTTLYDHAARVRKALGAPVQSVTVNTSAFKPSVLSYMSGDRARFIAKDGWVNLDFPGVRITDKALRGGRDSGPYATLILDLNDFEAPDEGEGVSADDG